MSGSEEALVCRACGSKGAFVSLDFRRHLLLRLFSLSTNASSFTAALNHADRAQSTARTHPSIHPKSLSGRHSQFACAQTMGTQATTVQSPVDVVNPLRRRSPHAAAIIDLSHHEAILDSVQRWPTAIIIDDNRAEEEDIGGGGD
ncbi:hypothetical protein M0R45_020656 [Rubus argutus]|uniref:Uncharacterized protein n=1 Tax=Rubus argutus TaxID=59490 RepID=A0AAW1X910_RUBAR